MLNHCSLVLRIVRRADNKIYWALGLMCSAGGCLGGWCKDPYVLLDFPMGWAEPSSGCGVETGSLGGGGTSPVELAAFARHVSYFAAIQSLTPSWD